MKCAKGIRTVIFDKNSDFFRFDVCDNLIESLYGAEVCASVRKNVSECEDFSYVFSESSKHMLVHDVFWDGV